MTVIWPSRVTRNLHILLPVSEGSHIAASEAGHSAGLVPASTLMLTPIASSLCSVCLSKYGPLLAEGASQALDFAGVIVRDKPELSVRCSVRDGCSVESSTRTGNACDSMQ